MTTFFKTTENTVKTEMRDCPVCHGATGTRSWKLRCPYCDGAGWIFVKNDKPVPFGLGQWREVSGEATT